MSLRVGLRQRLSSVSGITFLALALTACLLLALTIGSTPAPAIHNQYGGTDIAISADRAWTLFPGDCVNVSWQLEGIRSVYINGQGKIGAGEIPFCQALRSSSLVFEVTAQNGIYRELQLKIHHLPDLLLYLFGFVGVLGTGVMAIYYLYSPKLNRRPPITRLLIIGITLAIIGVLLRLAPHAAPAIDHDDGNVAVRFWAVRDSIIFPHECIDLHWSVTGAESIRLAGEQISLDQNPGSGEFCAGDGTSATLETTARDGARREHTLTFASLFPTPLSPPAATVWSLLLLILALIVFGVLIWQGIRRNWRSLSMFDKLALTACILFPFAFFLPFGFDSPAHWENWTLHSYAEGGPPGFFHAWIVSRFTGLVHRALAYLISSESFVGYNLINCLIHSAMAAVVYGILRLGKVSPLYAFLMALLFSVYPVNPNQLSMRASLQNYSKLFLLVAIYLALVFCRRPTRLTLSGLWLALTFSVNSFESGLLLVTLVPLLWWLPDRKLSWRNLNLTAIWYLAPAFKLGQFVLLSTTGREFYQSGLLSPGGDASGMLDTAVQTFLDVTGWVYPYTFFGAWRDSVQTLEARAWWLPTLLLLASIAAVAWYLARDRTAAFAPSSQKLVLSLITGLLLVIPAIGVLMWIPLYNSDPWRMCLYVPIGAVIAVFAGILLLTIPIRNRGKRDAAIVGLCLLLLLPAFSWLFVQNERLIESANRKANIAREIIKIAPAPKPETQILLVTEMDSVFLHQHDIFALLQRDMLDSALRVLYQSNAPEFAYFCVSINECSYTSSRDTVFSSAKPGELLQRTLVFKLNDDLSVELLPDPAAFLRLEINTPYDAANLFNADAPLPPRLSTMLRANTQA